MNPALPTVAVIADQACHLGEGPLWHAAHKSLYWVDILSPKILRYDVGSGRSMAFPQERVVGGFTIQADGSLLLFRDKGNVVTWRDGEETETVIDSIPGEEAQRFNDVIADPEGRVFAGTLTLGNWADIEKRTGRLYRIERDGSYRVLFDGIGISNGMGFAPDLTKFYFVDSYDCTVWQFDYDRASGDITNRRLLIQGHPDQGRPDGMTVDSEGDLWVAMVIAGRIIRYRPDGAERQRIQMPTTFTTSLTFGGEDFARLFVVTGMAHEREKLGPAAGATFAVDAGARGRPEFVSRVRVA